ncbi:MAG: hypothetical protein ACOYJJ_07630 [Anaerovoracaceae bacterium]|jgi:hypothetical protein
MMTCFGRSRRSAKVMILVLAFVLALVMSPVDVSAEEDDAMLYRPANYSHFYFGEKMPVSFDLYSGYDDYIAEDYENYEDDEDYDEEEDYEDYDDEDYDEEEDYEEEDYEDEEDYAEEDYDDEDYDDYDDEDGIEYEEGDTVYTMPYLGFYAYDNDAGEFEEEPTVEYIYYDTVGPEDAGSYEDSFKLTRNDFDPGTYLLTLEGLPVSRSDMTVEDFDDYMDYVYWDLYTDNEDTPFDSVVITISRLKAPSKLKTSAGRKKVSLSFRKATGASRTRVYRSTKKSSGYQYIGSTTSSKYTDRKVKKGRKYYYKCRTMRNVHGKIYSSYSKVVKCKKVK